MLQDASRVCVAVLRCMFHVHIHEAHALTCVPYTVQWIIASARLHTRMQLLKACTCVLAWSVAFYQRIKVSMREVNSKTYNFIKSLEH